MGFNVDSRLRNVTAVLGPTNTGKTHLAIERMLGHDTGMIGLPLRLLAREVYDKVVTKVGHGQVALITGEEKIRPENPRYWVSTVEAMPREISVDFLAIDEIQLAGDPERGHVFTDRLLHARGERETLLLGAGTMRDAIAELVEGANFITRPRLSKLTYSGQKKITRLPARSAIVAFSANDVYAIAELIRRQRGGAAVVLGALSPRTRNAQVALYQSGDVDFLVATDAIGMGLNLDVDHVAFSAVRKFDGQNFRQLTANELGQIAGRAGRHMNDGTFGVTGDVQPFEADLVDRLESHIFEPVKTLQWRSRSLDFSSPDALRESLRSVPREARLVRARMADDVLALEAVCNDPDVVRLATAPAAVAKLWDVCQVPDYRKISAQSHADLVGTIYKFLLSGDERIPEDWFAKQVAFADRTDGDIDTLANRIAHIRTWTFVSNRQDWLKDPAHWQERTRKIEDSLSDALHVCLTQRFVDRRTSALMKGLRAKEDLSADIGDDGAIVVESHYVGRLRGFRFYPDTSEDGIHGKAARHAAAQVLAKEMTMRVRRVVSAKNDAFTLMRNGKILWREEEIAKLEAGESLLKPTVVLIADEHLTAPDREKVQERLDTWIASTIGERLKPLVDLSAADDVTGLARGIAFRLCEELGGIKRETVAAEMKSLDQTARAQLRKYGVRFGAFNIFMPLLLKPAASELKLTLWLLKHADGHRLDLDELPELPRAGLTSAPCQPAVPSDFYRVYGFHVCGPRVVRLDILERLADLIRPMLAWRSPKDGEQSGAQAPPKGATGDGGFTVTPEMMSILGCSPEELSHVLTALGFHVERKPVDKADALVAAGGDQVIESTGTGPEGQGEAHGTSLVSSADESDSGNVGAHTAAAEAPTSPSNADDIANTADTAGGSAEISAASDTQDAGKEKPEPDYIEIWRPRRRRDGGFRDHGGRNRRARYRGTGGKPDARATGETGQRREAAQSEGGKAGGKRFGQRPKDGGRRKGAGKGDGRDSFAKAGGNRGHPAGKGSRKPPVKVADPDSPFAALGALKEQLEKRSRDPSSS